MPVLAAPDDTTLIGLARNTSGPATGVNATAEVPLVSPATSRSAFCTAGFAFVSDRLMSERICEPATPT